MPLMKTLALPPTIAEQLRNALSGPPSEFQRLRDALRSPPSALQQFREMTERMRGGTDLDEAPDALGHARAPARPPPAPATIKTRRGAPLIHDWDTIERLDAAFTGRYFADNKRVPGWKEREDALKEVLGDATPHLKTLQQHLPKIALLKERYSRSI